MYWNKALILRSFVQYFCITALFLGHSPQSSALTKQECDDLKPSEMTAKQQRECGRFSAEEDTCQRTANAADYARTELNRKCGDAGLGTQACMDQMKKCASAGGGEEYKGEEDLLLAFSNVLGIPQGQVGDKCPDMSGQDFFEEKEKVEKDLDDINEDLTDVKKEIADLNKDFSEKVKDVQEEIADAQKEFKQKQLDIKKEQRERAADYAKTSAELAKSIRDKQSLILRKRQDINNIYRSKNSTLIAMSEGVSRRTCREKARKLKKEYESTSGGSQGSLIARATQKKKDIQNEYDICMAQFDQQRISLMEQTDQKVEQTQDEINSAQSDIDNMVQQLSSMQSQEAEAKQDENTAINNEMTALNEKISRATAELQSLQQTTQQQAEALTQKQNYYQQKATRASNSLMQMEASGAPKKKSTASIAQVSSAYTEYADAVYQIPAECSYKGKEEILRQASGVTGKKYIDSKSNSKSKSGSR